MTGIKEKVKDALHIGDHKGTAATGTYDPSPLSHGNTATTGYSDAAGTGVANTATTATGASTGYGSGGVVSGASDGTRTDSQVQVQGYQEAPVNTGEKVFTVTEDHAVEKERRERWVEHQPVEREYVTKVEATGRDTTGPVTAEGGRATEAVVNEATAYNTGTTTVQGVQGHPAQTY